MAGDCLGRTPFASLIACILTCIGVGLFAGTQFRAIDIVLRRIFEGLFLFTIPWLESIQIAFVIIAVVMGLYSFILLAFGFLATGATRQNIYSGAQCIMGGRVSAAFFMVLTYILNICWIVMTGFLCMCIIIWIMLNSICINEIENREIWYYENYCLNLSRFGIYRNFTEGLDKNALCDETELGEFCQHVKDSLPMFVLAACGSSLIVLGMLNFLINMSSNYQKIKLSKEITEYRHAVDLEMTEGTISGLVAPQSGNYGDKAKKNRQKEIFSVLSNDNYRQPSYMPSNANSRQTRGYSASPANYNPGYTNTGAVSSFNNNPGNSAQSTSTYDTFSDSQTAASVSQNHPRPRPSLPSNSDSGGLPAYPVSDTGGSSRPTGAPRVSDNPAGRHAGLSGAPVGYSDSAAVPGAAPARYGNVRGHQAPQPGNDGDRQHPSISEA